MSARRGWMNVEKGVFVDFWVFTFHNLLAIERCSSEMVGHFRILMEVCLTTVRMMVLISEMMSAITNVFSSLM